MKYTVEMASDGMLHEIRSGIQVILILSLQQSERLVLLMGGIYDICRRDGL
jgi:hypothetical protein